MIVKGGFVHVAFALIKRITINPPFHKFDTGNPYAASVSRPSIVFLFFEENLLLLKCKFSHEISTFIIHFICFTVNLESVSYAI